MYLRREVRPVNRQLAIAGYLALKLNVWVDISAMGFCYPVPDFADVQHVMLSRATRDALCVALAALVRDGVIDGDHAIQMGRGVLRENARRVYGWR